MILLLIAAFAMLMLPVCGARGVILEVWEMDR